DGDHGAVHVGIDLALLGKERLGATFQVAEDEGGDLRGGELAVAESDAHDAPHLAGDAERKMPRFVADIVDALAHETFDRVHGPVRLGEQPPLRLAPDVHGAVGCHRHHGRHQPIAGAPLARSSRTSSSSSFKANTSSSSAGGTVCFDSELGTPPPVVVASPSRPSRYSTRAIGLLSVRYASLRYDERSRLARRSAGV